MHVSILARNLPTQELVIDDEERALRTVGRNTLLLNQLKLTRELFRFGMMNLDDKKTQVQPGLTCNVAPSYMGAADCVTREGGLCVRCLRARV